MTTSFLQLANVSLYEGISHEGVSCLEIDSVCTSQWPLCILRPASGRKDKEHICFLV